MSMSSLIFGIKQQVQNHWKSMGRLRGSDRLSISCGLKARSCTACSWRHALSTRASITSGLRGYLPSYRTKLQCLKQVSRTPCLPWSSSIMCDSLSSCTETHKNQFTYWLTLQQYLKYPTCSRGWCRITAKYLSICWWCKARWTEKLIFFFISLNLVIIYMLILQNSTYPCPLVSTIVKASVWVCCYSLLLLCEHQAVLRKQRPRWQCSC